MRTSCRFSSRARGFFRLGKGMGAVRGIAGELRGIFGEVKGIFPALPWGISGEHMGGFRGGHRYFSGGCGDCVDRNGIARGGSGGHRLHSRYTGAGQFPNVKAGRRGLGRASF